MNVQSLTAAILALGLVAGSVATAGAANSDPSRDTTRAGSNGRESSGRADNPGYLRGPGTGQSATPAGELQPIWHGMGTTRGERMSTPCKPDQIRQANGGCRAIGPD